ncbi:helix-turn-helix domain-containing protein [Paracandidimonas soli]|uniref:helix-turn-helix domain-containing protein n=1 Tax=Paracandidimonas soli TaxID=1917182 RepID=UPI0036152FFB
MRRLQAFRYALMPTGEQQRHMRRFVFNKALALQKERFAQGEKTLSYADLCKALVQWKARAQTCWLSDAPSQALQQALKDLERAYANFFAGLAALPQQPPCPGYGEECHRQPVRW